MYLTVEQLSWGGGLWLGLSTVYFNRRLHTPGGEGCLTVSLLLAKGRQQGDEGLWEATGWESHRLHFSQAMLNSGGGGGGAMGGGGGGWGVVSTSCPWSCLHLNLNLL